MEESWRLDQQVFEAARLAALSVLGVIIAWVALGWPASAVAAGDFTFGPASGGTKTTFTVQFTAPLSETGTLSNPMDFYTVDISGPAGVERR